MHTSHSLKFKKKEDINNVEISAFNAYCQGHHFLLSMLTVKDIIFNPVFARQEEIIQLDESGRLQHDVRFLGRRVSSEMTLGIEETLRFIFLPVLRANTDWGEELGSLKAIKVFLNDIAKYLKFSEVSSFR